MMHRPLQRAEIDAIDPTYCLSVHLAKQDEVATTAIPSGDHQGRTSIMHPA